MRAAAGDRGIGIAAGLLGLAIIGETLRLPEETLTGGPGTRFLPLLLGAIIAGLGALLAAGRPGGARLPAHGVPGTPGPGAREEEPAAPGAGRREPRRRIWLTLAAVGAYAVAFERLGFLPASPLFLSGLLLAYGERRWPVVAGVAGAATALAYAVFALWLRVPLPAGVLGR